MSCPINIENGYQYVKCGEFFFIFKSFYYEEATPVCEYHNSELAHVNIKNGIADDRSLEKVKMALNALGINESVHFMIGLRFEGENGVWSNGEKYNSQTSGPINLSPLVQHRSCSYVVVYGDLKKLIRYPCILSYVLCKEKQNNTNLTTLARPKEISTSIDTVATTTFPETSQPKTPNYNISTKFLTTFKPTTPNDSISTKASTTFKPKTSNYKITALPTTQSPFKTYFSEFSTSKSDVKFSKGDTKKITTKLGTDFKTSELTPQNLPTNSVLIGMSFATALLFLVVVILLAYILYGKSKRKGKKEDQSKTLKSRNLPDQIKAAYQTIDELNSNEATYAERKEKSKVKTEKNNKANENTKISYSTLVAAYTKVDENKS